MLAAIEVYNKPTFEYREETFSILAINAWELLLKARYLHLKRNVIGWLYIPTTGSVGQSPRGRGTRYKKTRSGANLTIELRTLMRLFSQPLTEPLPQQVTENIAGLVEVRDVSVHLAMLGPELRRRTLEFAAASVANFVTLARSWFGDVFDGRNVYMLPVGLIDVAHSTRGVALSSDEKRLIRHLDGLSSATPEGGSMFAVSIPLEVKLVRSEGPGVASVRPSSAPDSTRVLLEERDLLSMYKWDYRKLTDKLKQRYRDFIENAKYHALRKPLLSDARYARRRVLDPGNPRSAYKDFYHPDILEVFDQHFSKR